MRKFILILAVCLLSVGARADILTSGEYVVIQAPPPVGTLFYFGGALTNIDYSKTDQFGYPFVYSYTAYATVNGTSFYESANINCFPLVEPGCSHQGFHRTFLILPLQVGDIVDVATSFYANWQTDPMFLQYTGGVLYPVGAVPEPSTWAMMLLGFAGVGALVHRRRRRSITA